MLLITQAAVGLTLTGFIDFLFSISLILFSFFPFFFFETLRVFG